MAGTPEVRGAAGRGLVALVAAVAVAAVVGSGLAACGPSPAPTSSPSAPPSVMPAPDRDFAARVEDLTKIYGSGNTEVVAVKNASFTVARGESHQIAGLVETHAGAGIEPQDWNIEALVLALSDLFAAARNTREAGSLTIIATALIDTNQKGDDLIFQEFKGTGNMELVLDRKIAEQYIYPAVNIFRSGTRREELLLPPFQLEKINMLRRGLAGHKPIDAIQRVIQLMERAPNNAQMLVELPGRTS